MGSSRAPGLQRLPTRDHLGTLDLYPNSIKGLAFTAASPSPQQPNGLRAKLTAFASRSSSPPPTSRPLSAPQPQPVSSSQNAVALTISLPTCTLTRAFISIPLFGSEAVPSLELIYCIREHVLSISDRDIRRANFVWEL